MPRTAHRARELDSRGTLPRQVANLDKESLLCRLTLEATPVPPSSRRAAVRTSHARVSSRYLSKKLVILSRLLEHETISDDAKYPTFFA